MSVASINRSRASWKRSCDTVPTASGGPPERWRLNTSAKGSARDPENEYTIIHRHDEQLVNPLVSDIRHLKEDAAFERIEEIQDPRTKRFAIGQLQGVSSYLHEQLEKLRVGFGG